MIQPTKKHILVDLDKIPNETKSGFVLARVTQKPKMKEWNSSPTLYGNVIAIGDEITTIKVGNRIAFQRADAWRFEKETKALVKEETVLAVLE